MPLNSAFLSGTNVPWINFSEDIVVFPERSIATMDAALNDVRDAGGNAIRWWLHTNGCHSPELKENIVVGLHKDTIPIIKTVLDMAESKGIVVSLCLWSFDMLQNQGQNVVAMKKLLEEQYYTHSYIDNALIPILEQVGKHPAVMTWEIFNEPEGMTDIFGWADTRTEFKFIQQTINLLAGAIHRYALGVPVSIGSWCIKACSDVNNNFNYYRSDRLIDAGGDPGGYLDLYQVHFYPEHFGADLSPFHNPAHYWNLDKPILIGEFPNKGCSYGNAFPRKNTTESFLYACENGYSGCMTWKWPSEKNMGVFDDAKSALKAISIHDKYK